MRLTIYHDTQGNIAGLALSPPDSTPVQVQTEAYPGLHMTEIEPPTDVEFDLDSPQLYEDMEKLIENYRVESSSGGKDALTRKG